VVSAAATDALNPPCWLTPACPPARASQAPQEVKIAASFWNRKTGAVEASGGGVSRLQKKKHQINSLAAAAQTNSASLAQMSAQVMLCETPHSRKNPPELSANKGLGPHPLARPRSPSHILTSSSAGAQVEGSNGRKVRLVRVIEKQWRRGGGRGGVCTPAAKISAAQRPGLRPTRTVYH